MALNALTLGTSLWSREVERGRRDVTRDILAGKISEELFREHSGGTRITQAL